MLLLPHLMAQICEVSQLKTQGLRVAAGCQMRSPCALVEAPNPHGMVPTSSSNICKVLDSLHMLWMGIWVHHHAATATLTNGPDLGRVS